ncbi:hypothetical protein [Pectobacterium betavasculorum]|uniref:Polymerase nucleotidyl transferase domain-containing protein n=1 Tax=Pectobacterium betavasculorum TaxID=55207 RepID=A0ABR4UUT3_9GAMM|nr:hypothetical protein [Pectobacterium betavasculorum]KFX14680.1 hypothetical protein JV35_19020 [Pectobacterium betavasculorum]
MVLNFYEENKNIYTEYFDQLEQFLSGISYSIYLRGSANKPINHSLFKPWDIDIVLFSYEEINYKVVDKIRESTFYFNDKISHLGYPYIDICFFLKPKDNSADKYLLYLLKKDSYVIKGFNNKLVDNAEKPNKSELRELYNKNLDIIIKKHRSLPIEKNSIDYSRKIKNLIKSISRCGCILLLLKDDVFTRDVNNGLDALHRHFADNVFTKIKLPLTELNSSSDIDLALIKMRDNKVE